MDKPRKNGEYSFNQFRTNMLILEENYSFDNIDDVLFILSKNLECMNFFIYHFMKTRNTIGLAKLLELYTGRMLEIDLLLIKSTLSGNFFYAENVIPLLK